MAGAAAAATRDPLFEWLTLPDGKKQATLLFGTVRPRLVDALDLCGVPPHVMQAIRERGQAPAEAGSKEEEEKRKLPWLRRDPSGDTTLEDAVGMALLPEAHWEGKTMRVAEDTARAFERMEVMVAAGDKRGAKIFLSCFCTITKMFEVMEKVRKEEEVEQEKREAFAQGLHPRLGEHSLVRELSQVEEGLVRMVLEFASVPRSGEAARSLTMGERCI